MLTNVAKEKSAEDEPVSGDDKLPVGYMVCGGSWKTYHSIYSDVFLNQSCW